MGKKKAKKGDPTFDDDFPDTESSVVPHIQQADTPTQPKPAKKAKGKKGKRGGADWDSEEEDQKEKAPAPASPPPAKGKASAPKPTSTFAALGSEDEAESDASATHDKPSAAAFSALDEEEEEEHETVAATAAGSQQNTLRVAEILKASKHPSSAKLKVCTVSVGLDVFQVVTNASTAKKGMLVAYAGVGCRTPGSQMQISARDVRGVESSGMLCSAYDLGWADEPDEALVEMPLDFMPGDPCPSEMPAGVNLKAARTEAPSRGKKGKGKAKDIDLDDYPLQEPREEEAAAAPEPPAQAAGKKGKKQGLSLDDFPEDPEQDAAVASAAEAQDEPEPARKPANAKRKGRKAGMASAFDALDLEEPAEEAREAPASAADEPEPSSGAAFAALQDVEAAEEATAPEEDSEAGPAGEVLAALQIEQPEAAPAPKGKKKGKSKAAATAFDLLDEAEAGADSAQQNGDAPPLPPDVPPELQNGHAEPAALPAGGKKKKKVMKQADMDSLFASLAPDAPADAAAAANGEVASTAAEPAQEAAAGVKKKKKGAKAAVDFDALLAGVDGQASAPSSEPSEASAAEQPAVSQRESAGEEPAKGKKKKASKAAAGADIDALLAEIDGPHPAAATEAPPIPPAQPQEPQAAAELAGKGKKKKKKGGAAAAHEEDIDALLAQLDGPKPAEAPAPEAAQAAGPAAAAPEPAEAEPLTRSQGDEAAAVPEPSKKDKEGKKGPAAAAPTDDDDIDALLAEIGDGRPASADASSAPARSDAAAESGPAPAGQEAANAEDDDAAEDGKELTAAQRKRLKKKAKAKGGKAEAADEEPAEDTSSKKAGAKKAGGKPVSAAVRKMQEQVEARRAAEEAARLAEEERIRKEEEELQRLEEEAERAREDSLRRKQEKKDRRAEMKKAGLLLTGKAKKEADRLAAIREQMLRTAGDAPAGEAGQDAPAAKKKVVYGKKKAGPKKPSADAEAEAAREAELAAAEEAARKQAEEQRRVEEEQEQARAQQEAEAAAAAAQAAAEAEAVESEDELDWTEVDFKLPAQVAAEKEAAEKRKREEAVATVGEAAAKRASIAQPPTPAQAQPAKAGLAKPAAPGKSARAAQQAEESESESEEESDEESGDDSSEYTDSEDAAETAAEARLQAAKQKREERMAAARLAGSKDDLRSPICCILGHVDTGKTKLLDNIRRTNVQEGEAGGITQQIGATYVPGEAISARTEALHKQQPFSLKLPGLLIIDTPGHESFSNLRSRGSSLCDIAILVVDLMHSLEPQTIESINLLKMRKTPFIIALNKVDRLFDWQPVPNAPIQESLASQKEHVRAQFEQRLQQTMLNLNEQGLNVALYWQNKDVRKFVNIVPTSAITGEGLPDMLQLLVKLTQAMMAERLMFISELQCTVLEVKVVEGLGTTVDVVLVNGVLHEGDTIVLCGLQGPIVTSIRSLLTPHPLKELRVRGMYDHPKEVKAARGLKLAAQNLESAVAGTQLLVAGKDDDIETLKQEVMEDMHDIFSSVDRSGEGVCVQASTLGALEALLEFLRTPAVNIAVSGINIGPVHKRDVMRASVMLEKGRNKFACVLAFDVPVNREAQELADQVGVKVFTADIIYHLFDQFTAYLKQMKEEAQEAARMDAVFPCVLRILPTAVFNKKDPIILGVDILEGIAKVGTPLCVPSQGGMDLGRIASLELNHKPVNSAKAGESVAMKIEATKTEEATRLYGRHFDHQDALVSRISRKSIELLKQHFREDMTKPDWQLVIKLKKVFRID